MSIITRSPASRAPRDDLSLLAAWVNGWNSEIEDGSKMQTGDLSDASWASLTKFYDRRQMMDLIFTVGHYVMTSWALSAFGVPIEGGADAVGFDLRTKSGKIPGATLKPGEKEDWIETRGY